MDSSSISWLSEMGLDSPVFTDQFESMDPFNNDLAALLATELHEPPPKLQRPNPFPSTSNSNSSAPIILDFQNANSTQPSDMVKTPSEPSNAKKAPPQTYDHIAAERKRREQLRQQFVALSTIVPGLKKTDKTSVLGDAIKYLKYLQGRVDVLEEQATRKTMESAVLARNNHSLPEIEARVCSDQVLIRVHCENRKGALTDLIDKVDKLNLDIVNTHVASFGKTALDITITAEMENGFRLTVTEVVRRLGASLEVSP